MKSLIFLEQKKSDGHPIPARLMSTRDARDESTRERSPAQTLRTCGSVSTEIMPLTSMCTRNHRVSKRFAEIGMLATNRQAKMCATFCQRRPKEKNIRIFLNKCGGDSFYPPNVMHGSNAHINIAQ